MTPLRAGLFYGALALGAGALLGLLGELLLAPLLAGPAPALLEAAGLVALLWLAARMAAGRMASPTSRARAIMAATAVVLVVRVMEGAVGILLGTSDMAIDRAPRSIAELAAGLALLAWMAALPFLVRRRAIPVP